MSNPLLFKSALRLLIALFPPEGVDLLTMTPPPGDLHWTWPLFFGRTVQPCRRAIRLSLSRSLAIRRLPVSPQRPAAPLGAAPASPWPHAVAGQRHGAPT